MLITDDFVWYVLVNVVWLNNKIYLQCICDHANNQHTLDLDENIHSYMSLEEIGNSGWEMPKRILNHEHMKDREIPFKVVSEVILGRHDERFEN